MRKEDYKLVKKTGKYCSIRESKNNFYLFSGEVKLATFPKRSNTLKELLGEK